MLTKFRGIGGTDFDYKTEDSVTRPPYDKLRARQTSTRIHARFAPRRKATAQP